METVRSAGASRTASENKVPGMRPPTAENSSTAPYPTAPADEGSKASATGPKARNAPTPIAATPRYGNHSAGTPRCSRRPDATLPAMFTAAASAVAAPGALEAESIGRESGCHAQGHAGQLQEREQESGLRRRDAQFLRQHRQRRRQLAHVQRAGQAGQDHEQRRLRGSHQASNRCPVRRSCSRAANRSVIPAM